MGHANDGQDETVEATAEAGERGLENYPIDSLLIRSETRSVVDVVRRIQRGTFVLDPDFQREFLWKEELQSRLVESVLMRIPLPVFYVAEMQNGKLVVVDGLQRLTTLNRFHSGNLKLTLPKSQELDGKKYSDLNQILRDRFDDGQLVFFIIDPKVPDRVRLDIFERVNSGKPLTAQQMRNAIYSGTATSLLRDVARSIDFQSATDSALHSDEHRKAMDDREAINRVLAFMLIGWKDYSRTTYYDDFLGTALAAINSKATTRPDFADKLKTAFLRSMRINRAIFGRHAFRKHSAPTERQRPLNLALFDVLASVLSVYDEEQAKASGPAIRQGFYDLMEDGELQGAISRGTLKHSNVHTRFSKFVSMILEILGAPTNPDYLI